MSPNNSNLAHFLHTFDAQRLGEGDLSTGVNVLAAMACTIANIYRHGARIVSNNGSSYRVGTSLLAYGPQTASLVSEHVESLLAEYQSSLDSHCNEWEIAKKTIRGSLDGSRTDERFEVGPSYQSVSVVTGELMTSVSDSLAVLLTPNTNRIKRSLLENPLLFSHGAGSKQLSAAFERSHAEQLLVHDVLRSTSHCEDITSNGLPLIDGCITTGKISRTIRGHLLLSDPTHILDDVLKEDKTAKHLMMRLIWLVDGQAGPSLSLPNADQADGPRFECMEKRFRAALETAWLNRMDYSTNAPETIPLNMSEAQSRWIVFLKKMESKYSGITVAARPLLATLLFGLQKIVNSLPQSVEVEWYISDVENLARLLVQRMCNARAIILHDAAQEARERKLQAILAKLSSGPSSVRDLTRRHHRLLANEARDLLEELVSQGKVIQLEEDQYEMAINTHPYVTNPLTLEA